MLEERRERRVRELVAEMTLEEKLAQLVGVWLNVNRDEGVVAPLQDSMQGEEVAFEEFARQGLGQITRHYGTRPVEPLRASGALAARQRWLRDKTRLGIPALAHEECLTGVAAWRAAVYPVPPAWGASFDPGLVERMAAAIGADLRLLGVHQGLAPVLDVIRDQRWGRVEECVSEDPYEVATIGAAYVRGLQSAGVIATLKHFVGYSNSRAGRNLAPVHAGPREVADTLLFPFEVAVRDAGAGSVMNSYAEIDGVPMAADAHYLTRVLREEWGFEGTVVADYFSVAFLHTLHAVAEDAEDAAVQALTAGIDVELPTGVAYLEPLRDAVGSGRVDEALVDRALLRVLRQKARLGLLDDDYEPAEPGGPVDLDGPGAREVARLLAEESVVLLANDGVLPLGDAAGRRLAVVGPNADDVAALFGCYSFVQHVLPHFPGVEPGIAAPTLLEALRAEFPGAVIETARGTGVDDGDRSGIPAAARLAAGSDVAIVVLGDRSGLFGRGTSGEGCDAESLELPGAQRELAEAVIATGTPTVVVLMTGRGYAVPGLLRDAAAVVQAFFPGEEGAGAIARVLSGAVNPSGRLPMSLPRSAAGQPYSYLHPKLGGAGSVSNVDPAPALPFGHGLSYTSFAYGGMTAAATAPTGGSITCSVTVRNAGDRRGAEVVQLYAADRVASVTRPVAQLVGYARVELGPGESARVGFEVPARLLAFTGRDGRRVVEPGEVGLSVRRSVADVVEERTVTLTGPVHEITGAEPRLTAVTVEQEL
ncbi:glycoside hydrolase family 3 C-terminal domain-containing protein [Actinomadura sp. ATCC 31491]|uniref:Glycoside hydrolase family 3 C-terminal domain-containing protein n=1 Tax=Actinomadura luzonensis TaxID=2805427 RepID=A0ABT0FVF3_9ACTN|nr:glycoside hydrolase family 3 N-terminal domain-containing protein [Actinomadura luzonensis]MCK2216304.1 glycoside hydrolase family 3 C-terminal domain-containing protein [Actinomadura luzonensis]